MKATTKNTAAKKTASSSKKTAPSKPTTRSASSKTSGTDGGLRKLFVDQLKDIYWAEKALVKALPKMMKKATSEELVSALEDHLAETEGQVTRCEEVFAVIGVKPQAKTCDAMKGLLEEGISIMEETEEGSVRDAGIICASQKIEHYEMATYGCLVAWAQKLGEDEAAGLLEETLEEEKNADITLTEVAETAVNDEASEEEDEE